MDKIKHFVLPEHHNRLYTEEAISSVALARDVAEKVNELVDAYNELNEWQLAKHQEQDGAIRKGVLFMKDNLLNSLHDLLGLLESQGYFDERVKVYVDRLETRLNNLINNTPDAETANMELVDLRIASNGALYDSAGVAVRAQFEDLIKELADRVYGLYSYIGMLETSTQDGYLTTNVNTLLYAVPDTYHSVTTAKIPCKQGDIFAYMGRGRAQAYSCIMFNGSQIVHKLQYESEADYTEIIVPANVTHILFSSFCEKSSPVVFGVKTATPLIDIVKQNLAHNQTITWTAKNLFDKNDVELGYLTKTGEMSASQASYKTSLYIPVYGGETLYFYPACRIIGYFDKNKNIYLYDNEEKTEAFNITIPQDGYIRASFANGKVNSAVISRDPIAGYIPHEKVLSANLGFTDYQKEYLNTLQGANNSILNGKKWIACGDSFTAGDFNGATDYTIESGIYKGYNKVYPYLIGNRNNMVVINEAVNGSTLAQGKNPLTGERMQRIPQDADYITIKMGINDGSEHNATPLGVIDDIDNTTFYGAWNVLFNYLTTNFPFAKIGVIVSNGLDDMEQVTATIECCKRWGIPYLNMATGENVPLMLRSLRTDVDSEAKARRNQAFAVAWGNGNNHPNAKAHEFESYIIENWLCSL